MKDMLGILLFAFWVLLIATVAVWISKWAI